MKNEEKPRDGETIQEFANRKLAECLNESGLLELGDLVQTNKEIDEALKKLKTNKLVGDDLDPDEYDDSKDIKRGNNDVGRAYMESAIDRADQERKERRDRGE